MATTISTTTTENTVDSVPKYILLQNVSIKNFKNKNVGASPYADKYTDGPSYQPVSQYLECSGTLDRE